MSKTHLRLVSLVTLICFMTTGIAWGAPGAGMLAGSTGRETPTFLQIDIPQDLASIEEIYEAPAKADPTLVLHIQNLHGNYEAQSQIKKLLDYLYKTYAFKLIFVEGAAEKLNADYLRLFADDEQNRDLADYLTHKGQLTGPEFYLMDGPKDVEAIGIEQSDLYRKNLESFRAVYGAKEMIDKKLSGYDAKVDALASSVFTQGARKMISEWRKFESGHRDFLPYVKRLSQEAKKVLGLDLESLFAQVEWPQVTRLLVIQSMEAELNRKAAEEERARLAEFLNQIQVDPVIITAVKKLGERRISMSRLDANGKENRLENLPRYLLERLVAEAGPKGFYFHDYPAFSLYAGYLILQSELQSQALYEEINLLFEKILAEQTPSEKEKNLLELFRDMELLKKLMHLELTRKEWKRAAYRKEWINPRSIEKRLQDITLAAFSTSPDTKANGGESIDAFFDTALEFYDFARAREGAFYETIEREMGKSKSEKAVLVTGGFHTEGLMDLFREHEVNYGVLLPKILGSVADPENKYSEAMMESGSTLFDLATIEINSILQNPQTYQNQGGNNWERVQLVLNGFLNQGIYRNAEDAFKALNFASQGIFAKDQGFQFVLLPSKKVLFRVTGDRLLETVRAQNQFNVDAEGYLQSRDGKYLIFEVQPVPSEKPGSLKYRISIPRFQNQGETVDKPAPQTVNAADKNLPPQIPPTDSSAPQTALVRSEMRQDTFNEFFSEHLLPELLSADAASVRVYYQVEDNQDYLMIEKHSDDGKVGEVVKVAVEKEKLIEIFYHLRRRFSIDRGVQPPMDPAMIGLPGRGYTFVKWVDGEAEGLAVESAFVSDQTTDEDPMSMAEAILNKINGTEIKYFKINAVALPARPLVAGFEMVEFTKEKYPNESSYLEDRRSYMVWKHIEQSMDLKSILKDFAENKILALKRNAIVTSDDLVMGQSFLIERRISEGKFDDLIVIDEHLFIEFLKLFLESSLGFLDNPQHYFPPLVPAQANLDIDERERLQYSNSLELIKFAIEHSGLEEALIVGMLLTVMKNFQEGQLKGGTPAQKLFKAVFDDLGSKPTDSEKLRSWNAKMKIYNFSKIVDYWTDKGNRSEVRSSAHVDNVFEVVAAAKKVFEEGYVPKNTTSLLDIGAGRGLMTLLAMEHGIKNIAAVDINRENLNKLESKVAEQRGKSNYQGNVRTFGMDMFDLDVKDELGERALFDVATIANVIGLSLKNVRYDADVELRGEADKDIKIREIEKREEVFKKKLIEMLKRVYDHLEPGGRVVVLDRTLDLSGILEGFSTVHKNLMMHATDAADNWQKQKDFFEPLLTKAGFVNVNIHFGSVEEEDMDPYGDLEETVAVNTNFIVTAEKGIGSPAAWAKRSEARMTPDGEFFSDGAKFWESMDKEEKRVETGTVRNKAGAEFNLIFEFHPGFNYENGANGSRFKQKLPDSSKGIWNLGIFDREKKMIGFSAGKFGVDGANSISDVETFLAKDYRGQGLMTSVHEKIGEWLPEAIVWESGIGNPETIIDLARQLYKVNSNKGLETLISNPTTNNIREIQRILLAALESQEASLIFTHEFLKTTLVGNLLTKAGFEPMRLEVTEREYPVPARQILIIAERPPRSEARNDTRVRVEFPVQMSGDEMFRLGVREAILEGAAPSVQVSLNLGRIAGDAKTFEVMVKLLRERQLKASASPFDEVLNDLKGMPASDDLLNKPGIIAILTDKVPDETELQAIAGLVALNPDLAVQFFVKGTVPLSEEQKVFFGKIQNAKDRLGKPVGKRFEINTFSYAKAIQSKLQKIASKLSNEIAESIKERGGEANAAKIQDNFVVLGLEAMFEGISLPGGQQVYGAGDEGLIRLDIQSLVSARLSQNAAALIKEMPDVIKQTAPGQNVFEIMRTGIDSISQNLTDAFKKAYKVAVSA